MKALSRLMTHRTPSAHVPPGCVVLRRHVSQFRAHVGTSRSTASFHCAQIWRLHARASGNAHCQSRVQLLDTLEFSRPGADPAGDRAFAPRFGSPSDNISGFSNTRSSLSAQIADSLDTLEFIAFPFSRFLNSKSILPQPKYVKGLANEAKI